MTSSAPGLARPATNSKTRRCFRGALGGVFALVASAGVPVSASPVPPPAAPAAEPNYPFEGTWVRADRVCSAAAPHARTYAARDVTTSSGRCQFRKVAFGAGQWEIFEECRKPERSGHVTETIRMLSADSFLMKYQVSRLKIPRGRRFNRCTVAAPSTKTPSPAKQPQPNRDSDDRPGKS